jgi:hypothetical protein
MSGELVIRATVILATIGYTLAEWLRFRHPAAWPGSRLAWTAGAVLLMVHAAAAFHVRHGWSHSSAIESTSSQTRAVTGIDSGAGLYVNYAFLALWAGDAVWWWRRPRSYAARSAPVRNALAAVFFFMFLNGAVVFASGTFRWFGAACLTAVAAAWLFRAEQRRR